MQKTIESDDGSSIVIHSSSYPCITSKQVSAHSGHQLKIKLIEDSGAEHSIVPLSIFEQSLADVCVLKPSQRPVG